MSILIINQLKEQLLIEQEGLQYIRHPLSRAFAKGRITALEEILKILEG